MSPKLAAALVLSALACSAEPERPALRPAAGVFEERRPPRGSSSLSAEFVNRAGSLYRLTSVHCELDGLPVCDQTGELGDRFHLFTRTSAAGPHHLAVTATYRGESSVFPYMSGFRYTVHEDEALVLEANQNVIVTVRVVESGDPTRSLEDRLRMDFAPGRAD